MESYRGIEYEILKSYLGHIFKIMHPVRLLTGSDYLPMHSSQVIYWDYSISDLVLFAHYSFQKFATEELAEFVCHETIDKILKEYGD